MRAFAYFAVVSALALWAGNWTVARAVRDDISPGLITSGRVVLVMLVLAPLALPGLAARLREFRARDWAVLAGLGLFGGGVHNAMQYLGLHFTTATNGTLFFSLSPVTIMVLAGLFLGERVRAMQWIGVAVSFAGVLMIALRGEADALARLSFNPGDILCFISMIFWSGYTICLRLQRAALEPVQVLFMVCAVGLVTLLPWLAWDLANDPRAHFNLRGTAALLYSAFASVILAYAGWNYAVSRLGAARTGGFSHLLPAFGVIFAALFLGEYPAWYHFVGIALIFGGIALSSLKASSASSSR
ncbi:MAG TPA: DMT family transporter [Burkholderiales bacterium]|nr:DMT family transporter [Burkholderiales bacterium]